MYLHKSEGVLIFRELHSLSTDTAGIRRARL